MNSKTIAGIIISISLIGAAQPAFAGQLIGTLSGDEPDRLLISGSDVHPTISRLTGIDITDLNTTPLTNGPVDEYNGSLYFTNSTGFYKQKIGSTVSTKLRSGSHLYLVGMADRYALVSDSGPRGSFWYNASTKTRTDFTPKIKEILSGNITTRGGFDHPKVAMIAKNGKGKEKIFISDGDPSHLTELPLPRYAKSCQALSMSPNNTYLFIACTFNIPGQGNNLKGYVLANLDHTTISSAKRIISNKDYYDVEWESNGKLITIEADSNFNTSIIYRKISKGKIIGSETLAVDAPTQFESRDAVLTPYDVETNGPSAITLLFMIQFLDGNAPFVGPTVATKYNFDTQIGQVIFDDGTFHYLPN